MLQPTTFIHDFEGEPLVTLTWKGRPCWVARHLGARLGYSHEGKRLPNKILGDWADEFLPGHDFVVLTGEELTAFHDQLSGEASGEIRVGRGSLCLLFEPGFHLVLAKTDLPVGRRLRRFLVDHVLPQIARVGRYVPEEAVQPEPRVTPEPGPVPIPEVDRVLSLFPDLLPRGPLPRLRSLPERREARLAHAVRVRERSVDLADRRSRAAALYRLVEVLGDGMDPGVRFALELLAAQFVTELPLAELFEDPDGDDGGESPDIADAHEVLDHDEPLDARRAA